MRHFDYINCFYFSGHLGESIFLRVGTWVYPLFPELSPCFRSEQGIFIFPDIYSEHEGTTVGLTIPEDESEALHLVLSELLGITNDKRTRYFKNYLAFKTIPFFAMKILIVYLLVSYNFSIGFHIIIHWKNFLNIYVP